MKKKWYWIVGIAIIILIIISLLFYNFIFLNVTNECEIHGGKCYSFGDLFLQTCEDKNMTTLDYYCPLRTPQTRCCLLQQFKDECVIGKEIVSGSELSNYNCESLDNCGWRPLGCTESGTCRFACCPKNLTFSDETRSIYSRCFLQID